LNAFKSNEAWINQAMDMSVEVGEGVDLFVYAAAEFIYYHHYAQAVNKGVKAGLNQLLIMDEVTSLFWFVMMPWLLFRWMK
jgi:hypothetical protein